MVVARDLAGRRRRLGAVAEGQTRVPPFPPGHAAEIGGHVGIVVAGDPYRARAGAQLRQSRRILAVQPGVGLAVVEAVAEPDDAFGREGADRGLQTLQGAPRVVGRQQGPARVVGRALLEMEVRDRQRAAGGEERRARGMQEQELAAERIFEGHGARASMPSRRWPRQPECVRSPPADRRWPRRTPLRGRSPASPAPPAATRGRAGHGGSVP